MRFVHQMFKVKFSLETNLDLILILLFQLAQEIHMVEGPRGFLEQVWEKRLNMRSTFENLVLQEKFGIQNA
jgi:hypothetical protein